MYESHWSLQARPFDNRTTSSFYYPSESHQAALLKLHYAIETRRSIAIICGEAGVGKSMLLDQCIAQLPDSIGPTMRVSYPAMPSEQLLHYIARQLSSDTSIQERRDIGDSIESIDRVLRSNCADGHHALIAIDEAQLLESFGTLETLRLLLNLAVDQTEAESAFTLVLSGSIPLIAHLARNPALEDRIAVRCVIDRFEIQETMAYIAHRLRAAGCTQEIIFSNEAIQRIHQYTQGVPRRINRLCDLALMIGYAQDLKRVDARTIDLAQRELSTVAVAA